MRKKNSSLCSMHAARKWRHGDVDTKLKPGTQPGFKSEDPSYSSIHRQLRRQRGAARDQACWSCGRPAAHWAYVGPRGAPDRLAHDANLSLYSPMCVSCHRLYDNSFSDRTYPTRAYEVPWLEEGIRLRHSGLSYAQIAERVGREPASVYRTLKRHIPS